MTSTNGASSTHDIDPSKPLHPLDAPNWTEDNPFDSSGKLIYFTPPNPTSVYNLHHPTPLPTDRAPTVEELSEFFSVREYYDPSNPTQEEADFLAGYNGRVMTPSELEALTKWGLQNQEDERRARVEGTNVNPGWTQEELAEFERLRVEDEAMVAALSRSNSNSDSAGNGNGGDGQSNVDGYAAGNTHDYVYASPLTYLAPLCVSLFLLLCLTLYFISKRRSRLLARQHSASRAALAADLECAGTHPRSLSPSVPIPTEAEEPRTLERGWVFRRWLRVPHFVRGYRRRSDPMREVDEDWEVDVDDVGLAPPPYEEKVENDRGEVRRVVSAGSGADSVAGSTVPLRSVAGLGNYGRRASDSLELAAGDAMVGEVESGEEDEGSVRGYGSRNR